MHFLNVKKCIVKKYMVCSDGQRALSNQIQIKFFFFYCIPYIEATL